MSLKILEQLSNGLSELTQMVIPGVVTVQITSPSGTATGSGFLSDKEGHIITNAHLFSGVSNDINIITTDGASYKGTLIGTDVDTDIAVIKTDIEHPFLIEQGDSSRLRIGELIVTVGSPLSFTTTVTLGVISATGRRLESKNKKPMSDIIQTDAAINPGSSGGPMINTKVQIVGINTAVIQGAQGIGFAIPINTAKRISELLVNEGEVNRPKIGIGIFEDELGVIIDYILDDTSASIAGLQDGDIIKSIGNEKVRTTDDAYRLISGLVGKDDTTFEVLRNGEEKQIDMELVY